MGQLTILVVDDDPGIQDMLLDILQDEGYAVLSALNGQEGLACCRRRTPDLILLDLMMPLMDGREFGKRLRRIQPDHHIPIVVLSANEQANVHARDIGAAGCVHKPFDLEQLLHELLRCLASQSHAQRARGQPAP